MANNYFRFKQCTIQQEHCAMKVCTDACIFGAFIAGHINNRQPAVIHILDIGTGTGLLSLMLAQQLPFNGKIDAVELDEAAFQQAKQNFEQSQWTDRLRIFNQNALLFHPAKKYDFIICNPPFFEGDLISGNNKKNAAKHATMLTLIQLLSVIGENLGVNGSFAVLLPSHRAAYFIKIAMEAKYFFTEQLLLAHTSNHPFFRAILCFSRLKSTFTGNELIIKNIKGNYTPEFTGLLKEYYLHLEENNA
ncbi:MAG: methyltransferase [Ferruginibacter sp.]